MALLQNTIFVTLSTGEKDAASKEFSAEQMFWCLKVDFIVLGFAHVIFHYWSLNAVAGFLTLKLLTSILIG